MRFAVYASVVAALGVITAHAEDKPEPVKVETTFKGSVENLELLKDTPTYITNDEAFAKLDKAWKIEAKAGVIDFKKQMVVITTSRGSVLNLTVNKLGGDLRVNGFGTKDLRPGFRYVIGVVSRDGVKTVNGKAMEEPKPKE